MKAINDIKAEMNRMKRVIDFIEKNANKNFTVAELYELDGGYFISGPLMSGLLERHLIEVVGKRPSSYKKDVCVDGHWIEVDVPCEVNVYRQIHDFKWYQNVMLKTLTNAIMNV